MFSHGLREVDGLVARPSPPFDLSGRLRRWGGSLYPNRRADPHAKSNTRAEREVERASWPEALQRSRSSPGARRFVGRSEMLIREPTSSFLTHPELRSPGLARSWLRGVSGATSSSGGARRRGLLPGSPKPTRCLALTWLPGFFALFFG